MRALKIGIVGAGGIVLQRHLPGLRQLPGLEIAAVANSTPASSQKFIDAHAPEAKAAQSWEELIHLPELDIVWIGAAPFLHKPASIAALEAGKHTFCQARMAMNLADAEAMLAVAVARPHLVNMLCPPPQGLRSDAYIRKLLQDKVVGEVRTLRLQSFNAAFLDPAAPAHWRQRKEISGLNIMSLGIHTEILQRWFGDFAVTAAQGAIFTPVRAGYKVEVPDVLQVLAQFPNGPAATLEFNSVWSGPALEQLEITGTTGTLLLDYAKDEIRLWQNNAWKILETPAELSRDWSVESDFIAAVRNEAPRPHPDFADGVRYMRTVQTVADLLAK